MYMADFTLSRKPAWGRAVSFAEQFHVACFLVPLAVSIPQSSNILWYWHRDLNFVCLQPPLTAKWPHGFQVGIIRLVYNTYVSLPQIHVYEYLLLDGDVNSSAIKSTGSCPLTFQLNSSVTTAFALLVSECIVVWDFRENLGGIGATPRRSVLTREACLDACVADSQCVGADIDFTPLSNLCWHHYDPASRDNTRVAYNITNAVLVDRCLLGTITYWKSVLFV